MEQWTQTLITVLCTFIASGGFWAFLSALEYIQQGWISKDDYENLHDYLYIPYRNMGGNGTAERVMKEVEKLPIK